MLMYFLSSSFNIPICKGLSCNTGLLFVNSRAFKNYMLTMIVSAFIYAIKI